MAAASVESCQFVVQKCPRGRLGSVRHTCNRLRRMRGRFHQSKSQSLAPLLWTRESPKFWILKLLESPKHRRMRRRRLPDPRPIPEGVREPIYIRKK